MIIAIFVVFIALIIYFIVQNGKDRKDLMRTLIKNDEIITQEISDTEVNPGD